KSIVRPSSTKICRYRMIWPAQWQPDSAVFLRILHYINPRNNSLCNAIKQVMALALISKLRLLVSLCVAAHLTLAGPIKNGFDLSKVTVPAAEILPGGPPPDGIPAIDHPQFVK